LLILSGLLALAALVGLDVNTVRGWHQCADLFPTGYYLMNEALLLGLSLAVFLLGFAAFRSGRKRSSGALLLLSGLIGVYTVLDFGCLVLTSDSSGPGGKLCISHMNWYYRYVHNNQEGYWEDDLTAYAGVHKKPLIALVGDSFTWGQGLQGRNLRFSDRLRQSLPQVDVLNFGRGGLNTEEETNMILPDLVRVHPDVVVVCYLTNDIQDSVHLVRTEEVGLTVWQHRWLVASPLWNYLYWREGLGVGGSASRAFFSLVANYLDAPAFALHTRNIDAMIAKIRALGARPVFALMPFPHMWSDFRPDVRERIFDRVTRAVESQSVPVIPMQTLELRFPPGHFEVGPMDAHPSAAVNEAMAQMLTHWFKAHPDYLSGRASRGASSTGE
jgi:lysophospholipase L1-like esterase